MSATCSKCGRSGKVISNNNFDRPEEEVKGMLDAWCTINPVTQAKEVAKEAARRVASTLYKCENCSNVWRVW